LNLIHCFTQIGLEWWKANHAGFPHLSVLARRVLAIPATSAPSERLFSTAGNIYIYNDDVQI